jgi:hypothetical protein
MKRLNLRHFSKRFATLGVLAILAIGALVPATAFAASNQSSATKCGANLQCIINAGNQLIANRQTALNTLSGKISTDLSEKKLTSDQASVLQSDVTTNQTGLSNLKTKLDGEKTVLAARQDVANIFLQFRIYAVVLPRDYRHIVFDMEVNAKDKMQDAAPSIKTAIANAPASKQGQLNSLFSDYQKQVAAAESQLDTVQNDFAALTPENFNLNRASYLNTLHTLTNALKAARSDLHQGAKDLNEIAQILGIKK